MRNRDLNTMTKDELRRKLEEARYDLKDFAERFDNLSYGEFSRRQQERFRELAKRARTCVGNIGN